MLLNASAAPSFVVALALAELDPQFYPDYFRETLEYFSETQSPIGCNPAMALAKLRISGHTEDILRIYYG